VILKKSCDELHLPFVAMSTISEEMEIAGLSFSEKIQSQCKETTHKLQQAALSLCLLFLDSMFPSFDTISYTCLFLWMTIIWFYRYHLFGILMYDDSRPLCKDVTH